MLGPFRGRRSEDQGAHVGVGGYKKAEPDLAGKTRAVAPG